MNAATTRRLTAPLVALAALLAAVLLALAAGLGRGAHWNDDRSAPPLPAASAVTLPEPIPLANYAAVWKHPLFSPERQPTVRAAAGGSQFGDLELTGIILTRDRLHMALLRDRRDQSEVRLHEGETLEGSGVTLVEVRPRSAVFDTANGRTELTLPAGAPIDALRTADAPAASGDAPRRAPPPEPRGEERVTPAPPADPASNVERLRATIQQRRAARAAAANEREP